MQVIDTWAMEEDMKLIVFLVLTLLYTFLFFSFVVDKCIQLHSIVQVKNPVCISTASEWLF